MKDGNLANTTFTVTKVADPGGGHHFNVAVQTDVTHPTGFRPIGSGSTIEASVYKLNGVAPLGTLPMTSGAGSAYTVTIPVDDADLTSGEWIYATAVVNWVVDASDSEASQPKKAPA
jgi:hypothetical protein